MIEVDFQVNNSNDIYIFQNIFLILSRHNFDSKLIIEPSISSNGSYYDYTKEIEKAKKLNLSYLETSRSSDIVITTQGPEKLENYNGIKVRIHYGTALSPDSWSSHPNSVLPFNFVMVPGKYDKERYSQWISSNRIVIIGYPKYQRLLNPRKKYSKKVAGCDNGKKTILYLPTWGIKSSIDEYLESI